MDRVGRGNVRTFPYLKLNVRLGWIGLHRRQDVQADLAASDGSSGLSYPGLFQGSTDLLAEVLWFHLDQKMQGSAVLCVTARKPTTVYEFKDQDTVSFNVRAQRNF